MSVCLSLRLCVVQKKSQINIPWSVLFYPDISATITPLAPRLHSTGTAHKKKIAVCRPLRLYEDGASHFLLLLWFAEV